MIETADHKDRDAARSRLDANILVEAGAGTGKTALLTDRLLFQLLGSAQEIPINSIVALTFTEKAAGEIKLRLADRLAELMGALREGGAAPEPEASSKGPPAPAGWNASLRPAPEASSLTQAVLNKLRSSFKKTDSEILDRARLALENMDKSQIGTIHSFASHLLRLYPVQAGVDPSFKVDEGGFFDDLFKTEWVQFLDTELGESAPRAQAWLEVLRLAPLDALEELARELCQERLDLGAVASPDPDLAGRLEQMAAQLSRAGEGRPAARANSKILECLAAVSARLKELARAVRAENPGLFDDLEPKIKESKWPANWDPAGAGLYEQACRIALNCSAAQEALLRRASALLLPFAGRFRQAYSRAGFISFDGLLAKARNLLRDEPQLREELKHKYPVLLIDEFQDTDPLQGELLMFLVEAPGRPAARWQEIKPGPGRIFVVGDPKQSIYRFRGADIAAYHGFKQHILESGAALSCDLKTNFRSPDAILSPVNAVFERLMKYLPGFQAEFKPLLCAPAKPSAANGEGCCGIELVSVSAPQKEQAPFDAEVVQRAESAWITRWILTHCGEGKKCRYKDVAVLLRTATPLPVLLEAFKSRGIPYAVEMERHFYGMQEVIDLINLLRVLDNPEDRRALAGLLRSPLSGLNDADLYRLAWADGLTYLKDSADEKIGRLFAALRRLRAQVGRAPLTALVQAVFQELPFLELSAKAYFGQQTVSNLLKFGRLAAAASDEHGMTLKEFIERLAAEIKQPGREGESPLADEHLDAVRIMTIHKSKGLEFPVVFLSNASAGRGAGPAPVCLLDWASGRAGLRLPGVAVGAAMAWLEAQERLRQEHETVRLLYVAMTRAKEKLIILGKESGDRHALTSLLARAGAWPREEGGNMDVAGWKLPVHQVKADEAILAAVKPAQIRPALKPRASFQDLAKIWAGRVKRRDEALTKCWNMAATDYLREPRKAWLPDEETRGAGAAAASLIGQLCHKVLQAWDFSQKGDLPGALVAAGVGLERLSPEADWEAVRGEAREILESFLASPEAQELSQVEILGREIPFIYGQDGAVMRGSIDLLYRHGGKTWVADYKTGGGKDREKLRKKYEQQGAVYRAAVEKALKIKDVGFRIIFLKSK
ncbi:MAG: hypothetical protein A3J74_07285 [Elusimicrobia bacterium RIFCSPHIGHO2_02_FULL_57_9]|nr:MAG: hypothetical protein A3J74_07285 [Elusimicrobia bacterium RIFCSPHIGHO2_02_FULL_57_9]